MATATMTFGEYVDRWERNILDMMEKQATIDTFASQAKVLKELIGDKNIGEITGLEQQDLVTALKADGERSNRTVKAYVQLFRSILSQAVTEGVISEMPPKPKLPKIHRRQQAWLKWEEMRDLISVAGPYPKDKPTKVQMLFAILAETGTRIGEAAALRWRDFDFENKTLHIQRSLYKGKEQLPKTPAAIRKISVSDPLIAMLLAYRGETTPEDDRLFATSTGAGWGPEKSWTAVKRIFKKLKMQPVGMHAWRRGNTTFCRNVIGIPTTVVDYRTGHVSQGLTDGTYTITEAGDDAPWIDRIGELLFGDGLNGLVKKYGYQIKERKR